MESANQIISVLLGSSYIGLAGLLVGLICLVLYLKDRRIKKPCYSNRSFNITHGLASRFKGLEIRFLDQPVSELTVTTIAFWNAGGQTIDRNDVADPIRFKLKEGCRILQYELLRMTDPTNRAVLHPQEDGSEIRLEFEYFDKNEGVVINITHTGLTSEDIQVFGKIKGVRLIHRKVARESEGWRVGLFWILSTLFWIVFAILWMSYAKWSWQGTPWIGVTVFGLVAIHMLRMAYLHITRYMPKELDVFW